MGQFLFVLPQSKFASIKLWPGLKFWHWSLYNWTPISNDIDLFLVTWQNLCLCFLGLSACVQEYLYCLQLTDLCPECVCMCVLQWIAWVDTLVAILVFFPSCMCIFRSLVILKDRLHLMQANSNSNLPLSLFKSYLNKETITQNLHFM